MPRRSEPARTPRGVVDTAVLVAGTSGFRPRLPKRDNDSARLIRRWVERRPFVWLVPDDILDEYRHVLRRLGVRRATAGRVLNLLAESAEHVTGGSSRGLSPDPGDEPFCASAKVIAPGDPLPGGRSRSR